MEQVDHPSHYALPDDWEAIDVIATMSFERIEGFCLGNMVKYILRAAKKGGDTDYQKAAWYYRYLCTCVYPTYVEGFNPASTSVETMLRKFAGRVYFAPAATDAVFEEVRRRFEAFLVWWNQEQAQ
jgi:hypothetical protein